MPVHCFRVLLLASVVQVIFSIPSINIVCKTDIKDSAVFLDCAGEVLQDILHGVFKKVTETPVLAHYHSCL